MCVFVFFHCPYNSCTGAARDVHRGGGSEGHARSAFLRAQKDVITSEARWGEPNRAQWDWAILDLPRCPTGGNVHRMFTHMLRVSGPMRPHGCVQKCAESHAVAGHLWFQKP